MLETRDVVYAVLIAVAMSVFFHYRPLYSARSFIKDDAKEGFEVAYHGFRWMSGEVIGPEGSGAEVDPMRPPVQKQRLMIDAEYLKWSGREAEFYVRHVIRVNDGSLEGEERGREAHIKIRRRGSDWVYTLFKVRDGPSIVPGERSPWVDVLGG